MQMLAEEMSSLFSVKEDRRIAGLTLLVLLNVNLENVRSTNSPRVMWITSFPGAVIDGVSFVDCIFRGVRLVQNRELTGVRP